MMKAFREYWTFSAIRGAMTMLAAFFIVLMPQAVVSVMDLPRPLGLAVDCLATYCVIDAVGIVLLAILLPAQAPHRRWLYVRVAAGMALGAAFYLQVLNPQPVRLMWFVAAFAAIAALAELAIAVDTHREYHCWTCYASAGVLAVCALALPFANGLDVAGLCVALSGFVAAYGVSQLAGRCANAVSGVSRGPPRDSAGRCVERTCTGGPRVCDRSCADCPAGSICGDSTVAGQIALVYAQRHPSIVQAMRAPQVLAKT